MTHPHVEGVAKIPVTAVPHWEGNGWVKTDPPPKPPRPTKTLAVEVPDTPPGEDKKPEPKKAPARRKSDEEN